MIDDLDISKSIIYAGGTPKIEADVESDIFYLAIYGKVSGKDFKMAYSLTFHFKETTIELEAYDLNSPVDVSKKLLETEYASISLKDYHSDPKIEYTGTVKNANSFGDAFTGGSDEKTTTSPKGDGGLSPGALAGIIVGGVAFVAIIVVIVIFVMKKKKAQPVESN